MSTITWNVANLDRTLSDGRVSTVHYTVDARSDDDVYSAGAYGSLGLEGDVVTPYADLTEETVVGWVKAALGEEKVAEVVAALDAQLAEQATPTVGSGNPELIMIALIRPVLMSFLNSDKVKRLIVDMLATC